MRQQVKLYKLHYHDAHNTDRALKVSRPRPAAFNTHQKWATTLHYCSET